MTAPMKFRRLQLKSTAHKRVFFSHIEPKKMFPWPEIAPKIPDVQKDQLVKTLKFIIVAGLSHQRHIS